MLAACDGTVTAEDATAVRNTLRALLVPGFYGVADAAALLAGLDPELPQRLTDLVRDPVIRSGSATDLIWLDELVSARLRALLTE